MDLVAFAAFFAAVYIALPVAAFVTIRLFKPGLQPTDLTGLQQIVIQALMDLLLVGFIFFVIKVLHGRPILQSLHWHGSEKVPVLWLMSAGAFLAITVLIVSTLFPPPGESPLEKLLTTPESIVAFVVFGIALAPVMEEIVFRGFIYTLLADIYSHRVAVPVTAVLFAAVHISQLRGNLPAVGVILFVGYVLTVVRQRSNSLLPSVIMHTTYNAMIFGLAALGELFQRGKAV